MYNERLIYFIKEENMTKDKSHKMPENEQELEDTSTQINESDMAEEDATELEATDEKIQQLLTENAKLKDAYLRAYAESENTKKRCQQEIEKNAKFALASFAKELLSVADNLHRAITSISDDNNEQCKSLLEGVKMTQNELSKVFTKFGIKKIDSLDKVFDPNFEQVVQEVEDPSKPAGTVIAELQSAYLINDRILREAMVVVTKGGPK